MRDVSPTTADATRTVLFTLGQLVECAEEGVVVCRFTLSPDAWSEYEAMCASGQIPPEAEIDRCLRFLRTKDLWCWIGFR